MLAQDSRLTARRSAMIARDRYAYASHYGVADCVSFEAYSYLLLTSQPCHCGRDRRDAAVPPA